MTAQPHIQTHLKKQFEWCLTSLSIIKGAWSGDMAMGVSLAYGSFRTMYESFKVWEQMTNLTKHDKPSSNGVTATMGGGSIMGGPALTHQGNPSMGGLWAASKLTKQTLWAQQNAKTHSWFVHRPYTANVHSTTNITVPWVRLRKWVAENWIMSKNWLTKIWEHEQPIIEFKNM
jgi:hypothetical protein